MDFWEAQRKAKLKTRLYLSLFIFLTLGIATAAEIAFREFAPGANTTSIPFIALLFSFITFSVAGFQYLMYIKQGGAYVAESLGAYLVSTETDHPKERQLLNIVEEMALASALPTPLVYILSSQEINAFAAGTTPENAAICVTVGTLKNLNREELQGVIAHEFGHLYNGDVKISMRLAAMVMGFFFVLYIALRLLQFSSFRSNREDDEKKGGNPLLIAALIFLVSGALTWFFGSLLKCAVSREREYLADACAVQFTRSPDGIKNALKKIEKQAVSDMPKEGMAYSHLYIDDHLGWGRIFATHPPIQKRIEAIEGKKYLEQSPS